MTAAQPLRLSPEEYLERERHEEVRGEYVDGLVVAMAGASLRHNLVAANTAAALRDALKGRPCFVFQSDQRVRVEPKNRYSYPDIVVVCGTIETDPRDRETMTNPLLIVEVLSKSTAAYDRGQKSTAYRSLDSLASYLLVDPATRIVERYERDQRGWVLTDHEGGDLSLPALGITIAVTDLFLRIDDLPSEEDEALPG